MNLQGYEQQEQHQLEAVFIGSMIVNNDLIDECVINPEELIAHPSHSKLLEVLQYARNDLNYSSIDIVALTELIVEKGARMSDLGGVSYITGLISSVPSDPVFSYYQQKVRESYVEREIKHRTSQILQTIGRSGNIKEHIIRLQEEIVELEDMLITSKQDTMKRLEDTYDGFDATLEERKQLGSVVGANTLSKRLDDITAGHLPGTLEIVAARPAMGKTAYAISDGKAVTDNPNDAVIFFSAEMSIPQMRDRTTSMLGNIDGKKIKIGDLDDIDWKKYFYAVSQTKGRHFYIDDNPKMSFEYIRRKTKIMVKFLRGNGIENIVVYVDYLSYIYSEKRFNEKRLEVNYMVNGFKHIARELGITMVVLAQVGRQVEQRQDKRPMNSDLKESGEIEQTADMILFLYRDDYYDRESEKKNIVEIIIGKQRGGETGSVEMIYMRNFNKFIDLEVK